MRLPFAYRIIPGPRLNIEDTLAIVQVFLPMVNECVTVAVICDGVGGQEGGEVAAEITTKTLIGGITSNLLNQCGMIDAAPLTPQIIETALRDTMETANRNVLRQAAKMPKLARMATTAVCALAIGDCLYVTWIGDSRAYVYTEGTLRRLTRDHSELQHLIDAGCLDPTQATSHPRAHRITRCVGQAEGFQADLTTHRLTAGDIVLLTTDGLTDVLDDSQIGQTIDQAALGHASLDETARSLVRAAHEAHTSDNTSVLLFEPVPAIEILERTRTGAFPAVFAKIMCGAD